MRKTSILIASGIVCTAAVAPMVSALSPVVCTTEYMPVCGQPPMADCPLGKQCVQVMPNPKTYGNACNMRAE